ncbi:unnamed protein product [Symbiodinium natans]|uniref:Uncharacterized protein n=1 Tax=Symbiodinium natans TaxID=878477 RepID=A0A812TFF4_9DINO|nr:unnamed protein product [Symbiodinium natans]
MHGECSDNSCATSQNANITSLLGRISADDLFVLARGQEEEELAPVSLREYLKKMGKYGGYAGLAPDADLADAAADNEVSIRFQTTFLPVLEDAGRERG